MNYVCGWDGGGTKTRVYCRADDAAVLADLTFGPLNLNGARREVVMQTVRGGLECMSALSGGLSACRALVIGMAGASNAEAVTFVRAALREGGYNGPLRITGDHEIALAGAIKGVGAVLIAGTGGICLGRDARGKLYRTGGYGYLIDDCGSGYAIGRDILSAIVRAEDGRGPHTCFTKLIYDRLNVDGISSMIAWLYSAATGKRDIAALAPLLSDALAANDAAAQAIADSAGRTLAEMALNTWRRAGLSGGELALSGSVLERQPRIREQVIARCNAQYPDMRIISPRGTPAEGAARIAQTLARAAD